MHQDSNLNDDTESAHLKLESEFKSKSFRFNIGDTTTGASSANLKVGWH